MKIIECVPNISEGKDEKVITAVTNTLSSHDVKLLDVDSGADTNRTVITFIGEPSEVIKAAYGLIKKSCELIDLNNHMGTHARMGATDVCPLIPISNVTMDECIAYADELSKKVALDLKIPVFAYEKSAKNNERRNLANIRSGEFEGMSEKIKKRNWKPDFGINEIHPTAGVIAIGARNFLIAYNINLNTKDKSIASDIALDIREQGRNKRDKNGKFVRDKNGIPIKKPGFFKHCKAVGWYLDEHNISQISINLTDIEKTPPHVVFEKCRELARDRGVRVTGSEIVGLMPLKTVLEIGKFYLSKQKRSMGIPQKDIIDIAIKSLGLEDLSKFNYKEKIIDFLVSDKTESLTNLDIAAFLDELSSSSPAPGGGSVSALAGALAASLTSMVANLTIGKKKWESVYDEMCRIGELSQDLKDQLAILIDADTEAFNLVLQAYRLPKAANEDIKSRKNAIENAMKNAASVPYETMKLCCKTMELIKQVALNGNPNSITDAAVAGELALAGARGAALNVEINLIDIDDEIFSKEMKSDISTAITLALKETKLIRKIVQQKMQ